MHGWYEEQIWFKTSQVTEEYYKSFKWNKTYLLEYPFSYLKAWLKEVQTVLFPEHLKLEDVTMLL